ncbi:CGNR zinc finger domain-containing protein [Streptomyces flavofungini]|uniref:CGNR zinc finger domain-containing protein n=1 Tax=Streptomyces flavofungini TaxID=68200 RepID=UPI0025AFB6E0|nr:CGNR zinc finger domain-containing protein [Streptomyces flavofungini]WJV51604.1 CGNR zinc finger domain-containing protein [Streptomyces flavofungini]
MRSAQRAAALVNVLGADGAAAGPTAGPTDSLALRTELEAVLRAYGEADPLDVCAADVADMRAVAARLREVFAAPDVDAAATRLNRLLAEGCGPVRLTAHGGGSPWHIHLDSDDRAPWAEWFLASSCMALAVLVWDRQRPPGGLCASPRCANVYVTGGSGAERRYCSPRCATRERVAEHRRAKERGPSRSDRGRQEHEGREENR